MADKKITQLDELTAVSSDDLVHVVNDPSGTPANKKVTVQNFFDPIAVGTLRTTANTIIEAKSFFKANTTVTGVLIANNDHVQINTAKTPASNNATTVFGSPVAAHDGKLFWDENYLYVAVSNTVIKRVALEVF